MRAGITYDLKDDYLTQGYDTETCAEFDSVDTIDAIDAFLVARGCKTERIGNIRALVPALAAGKRWDIVFNIAEGIAGRGREAQVPALLDAYSIPYVFSDPLVLCLTLDKALAKRVVRDAGIATAGFFVAEKGESPTPPAQAYPLFVKPIAEGTGKGISAQSLVHNAQELFAATRGIHQRFGQSAIVEHYLPGREFTVGITGTGDHARVIGVMEILLLAGADPQGYTYDNKQQYEERVRYRLVDDAEAQAAAGVALGAWNALGCRDGGRVDIRSDAQGQPQFLEVNPLAGLHPVLGDLVILAGLAGLGYTDLIQRIFESALSDTSRFPVHPQPRITSYA